PGASPGPADPTPATTPAGCANPAVSDVERAESHEEPAPFPAQPKKLDVRDLIQLTRITVDLSRTMKDQANRPEQLKDQPKRAEQLKEQARQSIPSLPLVTRSLPLARSFAGEG